MRGALHLLCTIVLLPYLLLAAWFLILGDAIASGSLLSFLGTLLAHALWLMPWGILGFGAGFVILVVIGITDRLRWLGAACLFALAAGCLVVIGAIDAINSFGQLLFLAPCAGVLGCAAWILAAELRMRRPAAVGAVPGSTQAGRIR